MLKQKTYYIRIRKRASGFRLLKVYRDGCKPSETIVDPKIDTINRLFLDNQLSENETRQRFDDVRSQYYRRDGQLPPLGNTDNLKILEKFWRNYLKKRRGHRALKDPNAALQKYKRAIDVLGALSITTATEDDIQAAFDTTAEIKGWTVNNQQKIGSAIRAVLKFAGRSDVELIFSSQNAREDIVHITIEELKVITSSLQNNKLKLIVGAAFFTGMRIGELMCLSSSSILNHVIDVRNQKKRDGTISKTKTGSTRLAFIIPEGQKVVESWASSDKSLPVKVENLAHLMRKVSEKSIGKSIKFHDLRHSYAVHLVQSGAPLELVAQSLGNSMKVCERYYSGFKLTNYGIETLCKIMSSK